MRIPVLSRSESAAVFDAPPRANAVPLTRESLDRVRREMAAIVAAPRYVIRYHLAGNPGATTPEPAEGAMHDRGVLIGLGATNIEVVEVKP